MSSQLEPSASAALTKGAEDQKPLWNSLERWKLAFAAATPLALFVLGYIVSQSSAAREDAIRSELYRREDAIRIEGIRRENSLRSQASRAAEAARAAALAREETIRREGYDRDTQIRSEAAAREDAIRNGEIRRARFARLVDRRIAVWDRLGPRLTSLQDQMRGGLLDRDYDSAETDALIDGTNDIMNAQGPFFSREFISAYSQFMYEVENYRGYWREGRRFARGMGPYEPLSSQGVRVRRQYERLRWVASRDLEAITPPSGEPIRIIGANETEPSRPKR